MSGVCMLVSALICLQTPAPQKIIRDEKHHFQPHPGLVVVIEDNARKEALAPLSRLFDVLGYQLAIIPASRFKAGDAAFYYGVAARHASFENRKMRKWRQLIEDFGPEGHLLAIEKNSVIALGADDAGAFYALQSLIQIARSADSGWPCVQIRDWPDCAFRGIYLDVLPTLDQLQGLAGLKCNRIFFESPHFYTMEAVEARTWEKVFASARALHMTPVPVLPLFRNAGALLTRRPAAVEGRTAEDAITLNGDDWARLQHRNAIIGEGAPVLVQVSGIPCQEREDFCLEAGALAWPFEEESPPWLMRRIPGGRIPDGATVAARYSYAPPGSDALCPYAPETEALLKETLKPILSRLGARHLLFDLSQPTRLGQDLRGIGKREAAAVDAMARLAARAARSLDENVGLFFRFPVAHQEQAGLKGIRQVTAIGAPQELSGLNALPLLGGSATLAYQAGEGAAHRGGVLIHGLSAQDPAIRLGLDKAWSAAWPLRPWPARYNAFFGADLDQPPVEAVRLALMDFLNRWTLAGKSPEAAWENYEARYKADRKQFDEDNQEVHLVYRQFELLTQYLSLEAAYTKAPSEKHLRKLVDLVEAQAQLDPSFNQERRERMIETIEAQQLFAPASLLFGASLQYYRPMPSLGGGRLYEAPAMLTFEDTPYKTSATGDFGLALGRLCRIDFETVHAKKILLEVCENAADYRLLQTWEAKENNAGARGPMVLDKPVRARAFRITVESYGEQAVLRELRAFVKTEAAIAHCAYVKEGEQPGFPKSAEANGAFMNLDKTRLAEAPSAFYLSRDRDTLYIGVNAKEPRMHALAAGLREHDAALWREESIEVILQPDKGPVYRFMVNPLGTRYDAERVEAGRECWDKGWDVPWKAGVEQSEDGWMAVFALPWESLGARPRYGDAWRINVLRHRNNVSKEDAAWSISHDEAEPLGLGKLVFD